MRIANEVISGGNQVDPDAAPARLGVNGYDVGQDAITYYGLPAGAYIRYVEEGSAADNAGIQVGDIITELDGYDITSYSELASEMSFHYAGETCDIVVYRSGEYLTLSVTFDAATDSASNATVPA